LIEGQEGRIDIEAKLKNKILEVRIEDNGRGIPREIQSKMFTPNFTTKSSGMGLGLTIVRNILDQIGTEISFESEMGKGSVFILNFPVGANNKFDTV
jgi:signal transduction histidine kinase